MMFDGILLFFVHAMSVRQNFGEHDFASQPKHYSTGVFINHNTPIIILTGI